MVYNPYPPYEILQNRSIDFATMQQLRRFARYWDLVGNSGNFIESTPLIWKDNSPFDGFSRWSQWLYQRTRRTDSIALARLLELLFQFLTEENRLPHISVAEALWRDYQRGGRRDRPAFLKDFLPANRQPALTRPGPLPKRQARHAHSVRASGTRRLATDQD